MMSHSIKMLTGPPLRNSEPLLTFGADKSTKERQTEERREVKGQAVCTPQELKQVEAVNGSLSAPIHPLPLTSSNNTQGTQTPYPRSFYHAKQPWAQLDLNYIF